MRLRRSRECFDDNIYTAPPRLFVVISSRPRLSLGAQFIAECAVGFGLSVLVVVARARNPAVLLGLAGLIADVEVHFPNWNWAGFPTSATVAGCGYLAANWFVTRLVLAGIRKRLS